MTYSALLFDLDGTLVDSRRDLALSINLLRRRLGLEGLAESSVAEATGDGATLLVRRCLPAGMMRPEHVATFLEIYDRHLLDHTRPYPGIRELLAALEGMPMGVVTNKPLSHTRQILAGVDLAGCFTVAVGGDCAAEKKPSPLPVRLALQRLGVAQGGAALMIGDNHTDLRAGSAAGIDTCFCRWGIGDADGLVATLTVDSPAELQRRLLAGA